SPTVPLQPSVAVPPPVPAAVVPSVEAVSAKETVPTAVRASEGEQLKVGEKGTPHRDLATAKRTGRGGNWEVDANGVPIPPANEPGEKRTKHRDRTTTKRKPAGAEWEVDANGI